MLNVEIKHINEMTYWEGTVQLKTKNCGSERK